MHDDDEKTTLVELPEHWKRAKTPEQSALSLHLMKLTEQRKKVEKSQEI